MPALLFALLCACAAQGSHERRAAEATASERWLHGLQEAHAEADRVAAAEARRALERARSLPVPPAVSADDRRRVLQDVQFRLAVLALDARDAVRARQEAEEGLTLGKADDEFTANLYIAMGRAEAALGKAHEAASAYAAALTIHEHLLDRALQGEP